MLVIQQRERVSSFSQEHSCFDLSFSSAMPRDAKTEMSPSHNGDNIDGREELEVRLNVYNLASLSMAKKMYMGLRHPNKVLCFLGAGAYHSTIEIDGCEYSYSSNPVRDEDEEFDNITGVFMDTSEELSSFERKSHLLGHLKTNQFRNL